MHGAEHYKWQPHEQLAMESCRGGCLVEKGQGSRQALPSLLSLPAWLPVRHQCP